MGLHCDVCSLDLVDHFAYEGHIKGKKHLRNVEKNEKILKKKMNSVFVTNLPPSASKETLFKFFSKFGPIENHIFSQKYMIIEFQNRGPVHFLLNNPIRMNGIKFSIKKRIIRDESKTKTKKKEIVNQSLRDEDLIPISQVDDTFDVQLTSLLKAVQPDKDEIESKCNLICADLAQVFSTVFPKCAGYRYGSTVTGLYFKTSDVDILVDVGEHVIKTTDQTPKPPTGFQWTPQKVFKEAKKLLFSRSKLFTDLIQIPKAKTPIIKFTHIPTSMSVDVSFKNGICVYNSHLIKSYLFSDDRLRPLMIIIKCWAKMFNLIGPQKISCYAMTMLAIFYLQQPEVNILPTVAQLQETCTPHIIEGWQVAIDQKRLNSHKCTNKSSIPELLQGFFTFYGSFDFESSVACPFNGEIQTKENFNDQDKLPDSFMRYKQRVDQSIKLQHQKPMCVQDPFELSHNITGNAPPYVVLLFQKQCSLSAEVCREMMKNQNKNLLPTLFVTEAETKDTKVFVIDITSESYLTVGLPKDFDLRSDIPNKEQYIRENWYSVIFGLVKDFFERVMKLKVEILLTEGEAKHQKVGTPSNVHTNDNDTIVMHCTGSHRIWSHRKSKKSFIGPSISYMDHEAHVSDELIAIYPERNLDNVKIDFTCKFKKQQKPVHVSLLFEDTSHTNNIFREMRPFLSSKLRRIIKTMLMDMADKQYKI
ncbi:speckle targeted PIP5K1A-regulated poly(A) polymerase [Orussus abietinus]|uniref:speckle targeted PIP5K1A-regulated poly(A) polymerase n=1 Tax=Orussus abietinus TaxID=222816 RepID=UPI000626A6B8|nr:speckle targeted PIP5K1A-regulated poly(A) polymerase [Orussus abietinus]